MSKVNSPQENAALLEWLKTGAYLPEFMRDFHDQKDLFKAIDELVEKSANSVNWVDAQIFTVDVFLWFMARRGYTLQRNRSKQPFLDIEETIAAQNKRRSTAFHSALMDGLASQPTKGEAP